MTRKMLLQLWALCLLAVPATLGQCPARCSCRPDRLGRKQVVCRSGGMTDSSFFNYLDIDTRVLVVKAPEWNPNQLTIGPVFRRFSAFMEEITITHSSVPAVGENSFFGLRLLQRLDLSHNLLTNLYQNHFKGLDNLRHLDLAHNRIESVSSGAFQFTPRLRSLNLSDNSLPALAPSLFLRLTELHRLDLSGNALSGLDPDVFEDVPELRELRCARCDLTKISPRLYQMVPRLEVLDLSDNHLSTLRVGEYVQLRRLKKLYLAGNHFKSVDSLPFSGHRLQELDLGRNQLSVLPVELFRDVTVRRLDLSYNGLQTLPAALLRPLGDHLHWLSLAGNAIAARDLEAVGGAAPRLQHLSLADTGLVSLSDALWAALPRLVSLNMSANYLLSLSEHMLRPLHRLRRLDLSDNQLEALTEPVTAQLARLDVVRLHGNPWVCDACHVRPLLEFLRASELFVAACAAAGRRTCLRCAQPPQMAGLEVQLLNATVLPPCGGSADVSAAERCRRQRAGAGSDPAADARLERYCAAVQTQPPAAAASQLGVIVGCVLALLLLTAVILALLVYNRHSAIYYTHEDERDDADVYQKADVNKNKKRVRIATIDEMNGRDESPFVDEERHGDFQNG